MIYERKILFGAPVPLGAAQPHRAVKSRRALASDEPQYGLRGIATRYKKVFFHDGQFNYIMPGAFHATRGAFDDDYSSSEVKFLFSHDHGDEFARVADGSLVLASDDHGLGYHVTLGSDTKSGDLWRFVRDGRIAQASIGMVVLDAERKVIEGATVRIIHHARLTEISAVTEPAVDGTSCYAIEIAKARPFLAEFKSGALASEGAATVFRKFHRRLEEAAR